MDSITAIALIVLVISLICYLIVSWRILGILDKQLKESTDELRAEVEAAKQKREEVRVELAEFHRKGDE